MALSHLRSSLKVLKIGNKQMNYETLISAHEQALKTDNIDALAELLHDEATWESITVSSLKNAVRNKEETIEWFADQHWESDLAYRCIVDSENITVVTYETPDGNIFGH